MDALSSVLQADSVSDAQTNVTADRTLNATPSLANATAKLAKRDPTVAKVGSNPSSGHFLLFLHSYISFQAAFRVVLEWIVVSTASVKMAEVAVRILVLVSVLRATLGLAVSSNVRLIDSASIACRSAVVRMEAPATRSLDSVSALQASLAYSAKEVKARFGGATTNKDQLRSK